MYHLIKKDILIQKKAFLFAFLLTLFFSLSFTGMGSAGLALSVSTVTYALVLGASALEDKSNSDKLLVSLPIPRNKIVLAKYLSVYLFAAFAILLNSLINFLADLLRLPLDSFPLTVGGILGSIAMVTVLFSVSLPLIFKFGYIKSKIINFVLLFTVMFAGASFIDSILSQNTLESFAKSFPFTMPAVILAATFIILLISCLLSLTFYKNREF